MTLLWEWFSEWLLRMLIGDDEQQWRDGIICGERIRRSTEASDARLKEKRHGA